MTKEMKFFIYLLERYAEHRGETADVTYRSLKAANLVEYAIDMYELYHSEAIENAYADLDSRLSAKEREVAKPREGRAPSRPRPRQSAALPCGDGGFATVPMDKLDELVAVTSSHRTEPYVFNRADAYEETLV